MSVTESEAKVIFESEYKFHGECSVFGEALEIAIQALEKQIAKKMVIKNDNGRPRSACGGCGCFVLPASRFCSKCGQKLDWSDDE